MNFFHTLICIESIAQENYINNLIKYNSITKRIIARSSKDDKKFNTIIPLIE